VIIKNVLIGLSTPAAGSATDVTSRHRCSPINGVVMVT